MSTKTMSSAPQPPVGSTASRQAGLPVKHDLRLAYTLSLLLALLMAAAAVAGLLFRPAIYPTEEVFLAFAPVDLFHLLVGLPILLISMWLARRGKLAGLLCWPGVLLYVMYSYVTNLVGVPFGPLFLPYLLLIVLSAYAVIALVASIDAEAVRLRLAGTAPAKATGIFLIVITSLFVLLAVSEIITAAANQSPVSRLQRALWIADLATIAPAALAGGILLLRRKAPGYAGAPGLLLAYGLLFLGLLPVMVFQALYGGAAVDVAGLLMMLVLGLISVVLLALFLRGAEPEEAAETNPASTAKQP